MPDEQLAILAAADKIESQNIIASKARQLKAANELIAKLEAFLKTRFTPDHETLFEIEKYRKGAG